MGSNVADEMSKVVLEGSETTIEIKIKTLDSQTYSLRVHKQMPVPELKQQIASVTGVVSEQQRLICRGRVLKDDQLLSAYHVEDGHTLHMVVGQTVPPFSGSLSGHPASDPASSPSPAHRIQVAPGVVVETFDITDQGEGGLPDINRIVSAVLGAFGIDNSGSGNEGVDGQARDSVENERMTASSGRMASTLLQQQLGSTGQYNRSHGAFGLPTATSLDPLQPRVIPDSLTTLSLYLSQMRQEYVSDGGNTGHDASSHGTERTESNSAPPPVLAQERLPTPEFLAEVLLSTRELLMQQTAENLLQLGRDLNNQSNVTDPLARMITQSYAWRSGTLFQNLGAFLLELGRATMTLRMGQNSSEAVVSAGPAVFISQSGPNPLMVQPLPFQPGTNFGVAPLSTGHHGSGLGNDSVPGFIPRRIDIQIRRGVPAGRENANQEGQTGSQQPSAQGTAAPSEDQSRTVEPGPRLMPLRTMVAAIPGTLGRLPGLQRFQQVATGPSSDRRGFQAFREHQVNAPEAESRPTDGNSTNAAAEQGTLPGHRSRRVRFSVLSAGVTETPQPSEGEASVSLYDVLRSFFPGGIPHLDDPTVSQGTTTAPATDTPAPIGTPTMNAPEPENRDQGVFFSNLLREIMPLIAQPSGTTEPSPAHEPSIGAESSDVGTSRQQSDSPPTPPDSKRQKKE